MSEALKMYSLDTSAILQISKMYPEHLFPNVWKSLERAAEEGKILVLDKVYSELERKDDFSHTWLKERKKTMVHLSTAEVDIKTAEIVSNFPKIIDPDEEHEQADPFLIAHACLRKETVIVVTCEQPHSLPLQPNRKKDKIPNVCNHYEVENICSSLGGEKVIIQLFEALQFSNLG